MKRICKSAPPPELIALQTRLPQGTWDHARSDNAVTKNTSAYLCRVQTLEDQRGLCAYCEIFIRIDNSLVEHIHPKVDKSSSRNWELDWNNMIGVCRGGSYKYDTAPEYYSPPLPANLSCDAYKNKMILAGKLPEQCEGWILNPLQLVAFPNLFKINLDGTIHADSAACSTVTIVGNKHTSTEALVQYTIAMLNLNCQRLVGARKIVVTNIEKDKAAQRNLNKSAQEALPALCQKYFHTMWPQFFSTIRACLTPYSDEYLRAVDYQG